MKRKQPARNSGSNAKKEKISQISYDAQWKQIGSPIAADLKPLLILDGPGIPSSQVVYGFDMDDTIITPASGRKFGQGSDDWVLLFPEVADTLRELHKNGIKIAIFTNQGGIEKKKVTVPSICKKIENIINEIDIPIQVFISTGQSHYRKPSPCMWEYMQKNCNGGKNIDTSKSFYVGDAAGRPKGWKPGAKKDFSCSDRMFAANAKVQFATPEEFFLKEKPASFNWNSIDPNSLLKEVIAKNKRPVYASKSQEVVLLIGRPASGKSTFAERYFVSAGYVSINRDTLQTQKKCLDVTKQSLKSGKSVVVDNTNPSKEARKNYIDAAKSAGVPVRCFHLTTNDEIASHLNMFRQTQTQGKRRRVPYVGFRVYDKGFQSPSKSEGFTEVTMLDFKPSFDSKNDQDMFLQWTC
ncbi:Bifunctional polynucleotide phosphatase/kinase [Trichoplax sp. H2]|nr:Bifunctional polynucleotide phosphatase/kinase [Trichoplax sp. H2]|eukprot:RDD38009.1 Bifunctional polynucleotide phosphatase/kinase [Trichoplax sp. H2]